MHLPVTRQALAAGPHVLAQTGCSAGWLASASHASQQPLRLHCPGRLASVLPAAGAVAALQLTIHTTLQSTGQLTNNYHESTGFQADNVRGIILMCVACWLLPHMRRTMTRQLDIAITSIASTKYKHEHDCQHQCLAHRGLTIKTYSLQQVQQNDSNTLMSKQYMSCPIGQSKHITSRLELSI